MPKKPGPAVPPVVTVIVPPPPALPPVVVAPPPLPATPAVVTGTVPLSAPVVAPASIPAPAPIPAPAATPAPAAAAKSPVIVRVPRPAPTAAPVVAHAPIVAPAAAPAPIVAPAPAAAPVVAPTAAPAPAAAPIVAPIVAPAPIAVKAPAPPVYPVSTSGGNGSNGWGILGGLVLVFAVLALMGWWNSNPTEHKKVVTGAVATVTHVAKRGENFYLLADKAGEAREKIIQDNIELIRRNTESCKRRGQNLGPCTMALVDGELLAITSLLPGQSVIVNAPVTNNGK